MELKWKKNLNEEELERLAETALAQINERRYDLEIAESGKTDILKLGIAFSGKNVCVKAEEGS